MTGHTAPTTTKAALAAANGDNKLHQQPPTVADRKDGRDAHSRSQQRLQRPQVGMAVITVLGCTSVHKQQQQAAATIANNNNLPRQPQRL